MRTKRLTRKFFEHSAIAVARKLLGKILVRKIGKRIIKVRIRETEAYNGPKDLASHASKGCTKRTEVMFGPAGYAYVYLIYGIYHCFNIVTGPENYPAAVLIRAIDAFGVNGPGKFCRYLKINKNLNKEDLISSGKLWLEDDGIKIKPGQIKRSKRIGVDYAGPYKNKLWRFFVN